MAFAEVSQRTISWEVNQGLKPLYDRASCGTAEALPSRDRSQSSQSVVENYFNYFTEIEEHFQRRRGTILLLSTLDWALIETWKGAGVPLEAVLRGIDAAFDKYDQRPTKSKNVNSLAYCSQAVLTAAEDMKEAAVGASGNSTQSRTAGFEAEEIAAFLRGNAARLDTAALPEKEGFATRVWRGTVRGLCENLRNR